MYFSSKKTLGNSSITLRSLVKHSIFIRAGIDFITVGIMTEVIKIFLVLNCIKLNLINLSWKLKSIFVFLVCSYMYIFISTYTQWIYYRIIKCIPKFFLSIVFLLILLRTSKKRKILSERKGIFHVFEVLFTHTHPHTNTHETIYPIKICCNL